MRSSNFSSPASNRAASSITQTSYDRRALDCTSSRPLVQSSQQLMILAGSSSRVRETSCNDGGLERIVQIMKEIGDDGDDPLASYKWHLCMQCSSNLGARGSEHVRMRILEAGAIPVIVTILDNYLVAHGDSSEHRDRDGRGSQSLGSMSGANGVGSSAYNASDPGNAAGSSASNGDGSVPAYRGARYAQAGANVRPREGSIQTRSTAAPSLETNTRQTQDRPAQDSPTQSVPIQSVPTQSLTTQDLPTQGLQMQDLPTQGLPMQDRDTPLFEPVQDGIDAPSSRPVTAEDAPNINTNTTNGANGSTNDPVSASNANTASDATNANIANVTSTNTNATTNGANASAANVAADEVSDVSSQPPLEAITNLESFFATRSFTRTEPFPELMPPTSQSNQLNTRSNAEVNQSGMAQFVDGSLVPKEQDVFWALEIIAFVSKYSHSRREMQDTHFSPKSSSRPAEEASNLPVFPESEDFMDTDECQGHEYPLSHAHNHANNHAHSHAHSHAHEHSHHLHCSHETFENKDAALDAPSLRATHEHEHEHEHESISSSPTPTHACDAHGLPAPPPPSAEADMLVDADPPQAVAKFAEPNARAYYTYDFENKVDFEEEYLARSVNSFEIVEQFTAFRSPREFPHWACIIMRNFVRKDEGGIRQCANFACGKWEQFPRQFAKCRRCKRTKYCSKACQLKAWSMHRYWCSPSSSTSQHSSHSQQSAQTHSSLPASQPPHQHAHQHPQHQNAQLQQQVQPQQISGPSGTHAATQGVDNDMANDMAARARAPVVPQQTPVPPPSQSPS